MNLQTIQQPHKEFAAPEKENNFWNQIGAPMLTT
jgi:hypothetical protein